MFELICNKLDINYLYYVEFPAVYFILENIYKIYICEYMCVCA